LAQTPTAQAPLRGRRVRLYAQRGRLARGLARRGARAAAAHPRCLSKRVRERRFNVWHGTAPADGGQLAAVMLPDRFDYDASQELADLDGLPGYRHQGTFLVAEIEGGPLARYDHGRITGYVGPTAAAPVGAGDVQWRSAIVDIPVRRAERRWMLRQADGRRGGTPARAGRPNGSGCSSSFGNLTAGFLMLSLALLRLTRPVVGGFGDWLTDRLFGSGPAGRAAPDRQHVHLHDPPVPDRDAPRRRSATT
jgi:hypothetical protein